MTTAELGATIRKNPISIGCGLLSLALAVAIYLRSDRIPERNREYDEKSTLANRYALNNSNAVQLKEQLEAISAANKAIDARLVRARDIGINQRFFYKLESDSGVKILELRQLNAAPVAGAPAAASKSSFTHVGFTVSLQGDFTQLLQFLRGLEDGTHYCRVLSANCTGGRGAPIQLNLNLELLGRP